MLIKEIECICQLLIVSLIKQNCPQRGKKVTNVQKAVHMVYEWPLFYVTWYYTSILCKTKILCHSGTIQEQKETQIMHFLIDHPVNITYSTYIQTRRIAILKNKEESWWWTEHSNW